MSDAPAPLSYDMLTRLESREKLVVVRAEPFYFVFADMGGEVELTCYRRVGDELWDEFGQVDAGWPGEGPKGGWAASSRRPVGYIWHLGHSRHPVVTVRYRDELYKIETDDQGNWVFILETSLDAYDESLRILT